MQEQSPKNKAPEEEKRNMTENMESFGNRQAPKEVLVRNNHSTNKIKEMESLRVASSSNQGLRFTPNLHSVNPTDQAFTIKEESE